MKAFLASIIAIVCLSVFLWCHCLAEAEGADWKTLRQDAYGNKFSYDAESVKRADDGTIKVWAKSDGAKYWYKIDCKNQKARLLEEDGSAASEWFAIASASGDELLFKAVCP
jgi:hypothetical protein